MFKFRHPSRLILPLLLAALWSGACGKGPDQWLAKGRSQAQAGEHGKALASYDKALVDPGPHVAPTQLARAESLFQLGRWDQAARSALDSALGLSPVEARPARVLALRALAEAGDKAEGARVLALLGTEALQDPAVAAAAKKLGLDTGNSGQAASVPSAAPRKGFDLSKLNAMRVDIAAVTPVESLDKAAFPSQVEFQDPRKAVKQRSPDGKKLVWRGLEEGKGYYLFVSDADGGNARRLDACKNGYQPVWSPDSKRILYSAMDWTIEERNLFIHDLAANTSKRAFNASKKVGPLASWSPDGSKIVFTYFDELWITNASGIGRSMLNLSRRTRSPVSDARLFAWSSDGSRLAYAAREGGPIHLIDLTSKI